MSGVSVIGGGQSPSTFTISGTLAYSTNQTTVLIPFSVYNPNLEGSTPGAFSLIVVPEPASAAVFVASTLLLRRRRVS